MSRSASLLLVVAAVCLGPSPARADTLVLLAVNTSRPSSIHTDPHSEAARLFISIDGVGIDPQFGNLAPTLYGNTTYTTIGDARANGPEAADRKQSYG
jgi:hypothetical protein